MVDDQTDFPVEEVYFDPDVAKQNPDLVKKAIDDQAWYSSLGMVLAAICIVGGIVLFLAGITGKIGWSVTLLGQDSKLTDAAPGAVLFVMGFLIIGLSRYDVQIGGKKAT